MNKPLIVVCNKTDLQPLEGISEEDKKLVAEMKEGGILPEILDGHNVYDSVDPDVLQRLEELEREEGVKQAEEADEDSEMDDHEMTAEEKEVLAAIRRKKSVCIQEHKIKKSIAESRPIVPRKFDKDKNYTLERMGRDLSSTGLDPSKAIDRARSKSLARKSRKRDRDGSSDAMDMDVDRQSNKKLRLRSRICSMSISRSISRRPPSEVVPGEGYRDTAQKKKAIKLSKKAVRKRNKEARRGEADRVIPTLRPKHLFSGKRSTGKTHRR